MIVGLLLMIVGVAGAFLCYVSSRNLGDARDIQGQIVFSIAFLTPVGAGAALFLRYSIAGVPAHVAAAPALRRPGQHRPSGRSHR